MNVHSHHTWGNADAYEAYMGRWSRPMAEAALRWLQPAMGLDWLDVGCGTGALTGAIVDQAERHAVIGIDPSVHFLNTARHQTDDSRAQFMVATAAELPFPDATFDVVIAGLVLHLIPDPGSAVREMARVARPAGTVAVYVWDFTGERQFTHAFWNSATDLDPSASSYDPGAQSPICAAEPLADLLASAGLQEITVDSVPMPVVFRDFDDFWFPHLLKGSSPAQRYTATLDEAARATLRTRLLSTLPIAADGSIPLLGQVWAARGTRPR